MSIDPGRYWQDIDDPNWSDEKEAAFLTALSLWNIEHSLRPRDEYDVDVPPETFRAQVLAWYDARDRAFATLRSTCRGRLVLFLARVWGRASDLMERAVGGRG